MKANIEENEWYPVAETRTGDEIPDWFDSRYLIDIPDDVLKRWDEVFAAFNAVQNEIYVYHKQQCEQAKILNETEEYC